MWPAAQHLLTLPSRKPTAADNDATHGEMEYYDGLCFAAEANDMGAGEGRKGSWTAHRLGRARGSGRPQGRPATRGG
eukprot:8594-Eustigmatos_ZCMA.PRE.1